MSDMFTAVSAGFQSASHVEHVQLVAGFLGQREQFGGEFNVHGGHGGDVGYPNV